MKLRFLQRKISQFITRHFSLVLVIVFLMVLGLGYFLFISNNVKQIRDIGLVNLQTKLNILNSKKAKLDSLAKLNSRYEKINEDQKMALDQFLPKQSEIPFLVIEIRKFIENNGLTMKNIDIGQLNNFGASKSGDNSMVKELKITLSFGGVDSYFKLKDFLAKMSKALPLLELNSFIYNSGSTSYTLNLTTYYQ